MSSDLSAGEWRSEGCPTRDDRLILGMESGAGTARAEKTRRVSYFFPG